VALALHVSARAGDLAANLDRLSILNQRLIRAEEVRLMVARISAETRVAIATDDADESTLAIRAGRASAQALQVLVRDTLDTTGAPALPAETVRRIETYIQARLDVLAVAERSGIETAQRYFFERRIGSTRRDLEASLDITVESAQIQLDRERQAIETLNASLVQVQQQVLPAMIIAFVIGAIAALVRLYRRSQT
jgi:hypothetical protein